MRRKILSKRAKHNKRRYDSNTRNKFKNRTISKTQIWDIKRTEMYDNIDGNSSAE